MQNITIGFLFSWFFLNDQNIDRDLIIQQLEKATDMEGRLIAGAMTIAVNDINNNSTLLPNHTLQFIARNSWSDTLVGVQEMTRLMQEGAVAFIGPEQPCEVEAKVASAWNLPMISYVRTFIHSLLHVHV